MLVLDSTMVITVPRKLVVGEDRLRFGMESGSAVEGAVGGEEDRRWGRKGA